MSADNDTFVALCPRLFGIAYRMLGSAVDVEDIVQDAWLRWQNTDQDAVRDARAFLSTVTTRLSINSATSARARREHYVGPWLPEPLDTTADPAVGAEQAVLVDLAVLILLERLTPVERAVFVLREAFGYPFKEIADIVEVSETNARQICTRARRHVRGDRREAVDRSERDRLLRAFLAAAYSGDLGTLETMLSASVVALTDSGGTVTAARIPIRGIERVARYVAGVVEKFAGGSTAQFVTLNNSDAAIVMRGSDILGVYFISVTDDGIDGVYTMMNPDKLGQVRAS